MAQTNLAHRINAIQNTAEVIAQSLREMIHAAELKPGQPLIQERIAEMFEVSRVPVRDALQLLIGMGLAVNVPRRGVIVRPLSWQLLDELFEVRKILEGSAIRMAMRNATPEHQRRLDSVIARQAECLKTGDARQNAVLDDEFHRLLVRIGWKREVGGTHLRQLGNDQAGAVRLDGDARARAGLDRHLDQAAQAPPRGDQARRRRGGLRRHFREHRGLAAGDYRLFA